MTDLSRELEPILLAVVRAHRERTANGTRQPLMHLRHFGGHDLVEHHAWPEDAPPVGREELGLVRIDRLERSCSFAPTADARAAVEAYERELARAERAEAVDLRWSAVRPVLQAVVDVWEKNGAPATGSVPVSAVARSLERSQDDLPFIRALELLAEDDWLEVDYEHGVGGPIGVRPRIKALSGTRDWPGGDAQAAGERLLEALEQLAEGSDDEEERSKLTRVREFLLDLGSGTLSEIATKTMGGAL